MEGKPQVFRTASGQFLNVIGGVTQYIPLFSVPDSEAEIREKWEIPGFSEDYPTVWEEPMPKGPPENFERWRKIFREYYLVWDRQRKCLSVALPVAQLAERGNRNGALPPVQRIDGTFGKFLEWLSRNLPGEEEQ